MFCSENQLGEEKSEIYESNDYESLVGKLWEGEREGEREEREREREKKGREREREKGGKGREQEKDNE